VGGIKYTVTVELRGGDSGFVVDKSDIQPSFNEIWNGLTTHIDAISTSAATSRAVHVSSNTLAVATGVYFCANSHIF